MLEVLGSLADKSLLRQEEGGEEPRFRMLETIREYAREQLEASGEADALRRRHALYYLALAERGESHLEPRPRRQPGRPSGVDRPSASPRDLSWLDRLEAEHDNLRAALTWCAEGDVDLGLRLAASLWWFWVQRSHVAEGRGWLADLLGRRGSEAGAVRATALFAAARLARQQGDDAAAEPLYRERLAICRGLGDATRVAETLDRLGHIAAGRGDVAAARVLLEESLGAARQAGATLTVARSLEGLGKIALRQGDVVGGRALLEQGLAAYREADERPSLAEALHDLERVVSEQGDHEAARALGEEALELVREVGDDYGLVWVLQGRGDALLRQGDVAASRSFYEQSLAAARQSGLNFGVAWALCKLGRLARHQGDTSLARSRFEESLVLLKEWGHGPAIADVTREMAELEEAPNG